MMRPETVGFGINSGVGSKGEVSGQSSSSILVHSLLEKRNWNGLRLLIGLLIISKLDLKDRIHFTCPVFAVVLCYISLLSAILPSVRALIHICP